MLSARGIVAALIKSFAPSHNSVNLADRGNILAYYPHSVNTKAVNGSKRKTVQIRLNYAKPYTSWTQETVSTCRKQRRIVAKYGRK